MVHVKLWKYIFFIKLKDFYEKDICEIVFKDIVTSAEKLSSFVCNIHH